MKTSPSSMRSPNFRSSDAIADGTEPRWIGIVTPWAIISPSALHSDVEKSRQSRTIVE